MCSTNNPSDWVTFDDEGSTFPPANRLLSSSPSTPGSIPRPNGLKLPLPPLLGASRALRSVCSYPDHPRSGRPASSSSSDSDPGSVLPRFFIRSKEDEQEPQRRPDWTEEPVSPTFRWRPEEDSFFPRGLSISERRHGWSLMLRIPEKKNRMSSRQWGPVYLRLQPGALLQLFYEKGLEKPFRELQLNAYCLPSAPKLESSGEISTLKLEHVSYSEKNRHPPRAEAEQLLKFGSRQHADVEDLLASIQEELMLLPPPHPLHRHYERQELSLQVSDHVWMQLDEGGALRESHALTRLHCLAFLDAAVDCFLSLRAEIGDCSFHRCVEEAEFRQTRRVRFRPPAGCRVELMRFSTVGCGLPPLSVRAAVRVQGAYVELQAWLRGFASPVAACENVVLRVPLPGDWVRVRRSKARINRHACLAEAESETMMQASVGVVKYENAHQALVWRVERLPPKNVAADQPQCFSCTLDLSSRQEVSAPCFPFVLVECEVAGAAASHTRVTSLASDCDVQPEKRVSGRAFYRCQVDIQKTVV